MRKKSELYYKKENCKEIVKEYINILRTGDADLRF